MAPQHGIAQVHLKRPLTVQGAPLVARGFAVAFASMLAPLLARGSMMELGN